MNATTKVGQQVEIDGPLCLAAAERIVDGHCQVALSAQAQERCDAAFQRLQTVIAQNRHVYGITTGFGPLANRIVDAQDGERLQQNLIYHLATGVGAAFSWRASRAIVLARLMTLVQGVSGACSETLDRLVTLLNSDLAPEVPERGTVGASGDLTPLAHMVLCFQGHGHFLTDSGERIPAMQALGRMGLGPLDLSHRDGLALVNGTSAMTGLAVLNATRLERALNWSVVLSGAMAEALTGRVEAWSPEFAKFRPHPGQVRATRLLNLVVDGSERLNRTPLSTHQLGSVPNVHAQAMLAQDAYTLRCAPQVIGAVWDTAEWHRGVVETELNSVTHNPIFPQSSSVAALHGGNFMGCHIALTSDAAAAATAVLAGYHERQIARITDEKLNGGLPAFLSGGTIGLSSGLMGAQVTATALLAEIRATGPASVHSISTNAANQDVVSQGTIAARLLRDKLDLLFRIQAILAIAASQALDLRDRAGAVGSLSQSAQDLKAFVRETSTFLGEDRPLGQEIETVTARMDTAQALEGALRKDEAAT